MSASSNAGDRFIVGFDLGMSTLGEKSEVAKVQHELRKLSTAFVFGKHANPGFLVVLSSLAVSLKTTDALARLGEAMGEPMEFWDVSLLGHFDMERVLPEIGHRSLMEVFAGKTLIVLHQYFDVSGTHPPIPCATLDFLSAAQYQKAKQELGMRFLFGFQPSAHVDLGALNYFAVPHVAQHFQSPSLDTFKASLKRGEMAHFAHECEITVASKLMSSKPHVLHKALEGAKVFLMRDFPQRDCLVTAVAEQSKGMAGKLLLRWGLDKIHVNCTEETDVAGPLCFDFDDTGVMATETLQQLLCGLQDERLIGAWHAVMARMMNKQDFDAPVASALLRVVLKRLFVEHREMRAGVKAPTLFMHQVASSFQGISPLHGEAQEYLMDAVVKWKRFDGMQEKLLHQALGRNRTHQASAQAWDQVVKMGLKPGAQRELPAKEAAYKTEMRAHFKGFKGHLSAKLHAYEAKVKATVPARQGFPLLSASVDSEESYQAKLALRTQAEKRRLQVEQEHEESLMGLEASED
jgi:hypothetical protein